MQSHLMNLAFGRILSTLIVAGGWALAGMRTVLDLIGYSTVPDDAKVAQGLIESSLLWLLSLPIWLPWGFAFVATVLLIWVSWPRHAAPPVSEALITSTGTTDLLAVAKQPKLPPVADRPKSIKPINRSELPPYEVERQLRAIDEALSHASNDLGVVIDGGRELDRRYQYAYLEDAQRRVTYIEDASRVVEGLRQFIKDAGNLTTKYSHYPKIVEICQPDALEAIFEHFQEFLTNYKLLSQDGLRVMELHVFTRFMHPCKTSFDVALIDLEAWQKATVAALSTFRTELTG